MKSTQLRELVSNWRNGDFEIPTLSGGEVAFCVQHLMANYINPVKDKQLISLVQDFCAEVYASQG